MKNLKITRRQTKIILNALTRNYRTLSREVQNPSYDEETVTNLQAKMRYIADLHELISIWMIEWEIQEGLKSRDYDKSIRRLDGNYTWLR